MDWKREVKDIHLFFKLPFLGTHPAPWISHKVKAKLYLGRLVSSEETAEVPCSPLHSAK